MELTSFTIIRENTQCLKGGTKIVFSRRKIEKLVLKEVLKYGYLLGLL